MKKFKTIKRSIIVILTLCMLLSATGIDVYATSISDENQIVSEETTVGTEQITIFAEENTVTDNETMATTKDTMPELMPMMARGCDEEDPYPLTNGYYGDPGISGGDMRVMGGGYSAACAFFTYLTNCPSVVNVTTPIPGGGTARITPSISSASGYAVQIKTSAGQPFNSQRIHFN